MDKTLKRLKLLFLGLFLIGAAASGIYQIFWLRPEKACLARGNWWSNTQRVCAVPVDITQITGRAKGAPAAAAAAAAAPAAAPAEAAPAN